MTVRFLQLLLAILFSLLAVPVAAEAPDAIAAAAKNLDTGRQELSAIDQALDRPLDRKQRQALRDRATGVAAEANDAVSALQAHTQLVDARVAQLGPVTPGVIEAPDIRAQRSLLAKQRSTLDSETKRGRLLAVDAQQLQDEISASQAEQFSQRILARTASPASPGFWDPIGRAFPRDLRRTLYFASSGARRFAAGLLSSRGWLAAAGLVLGLALLFPLRLWLRNIGRRYVIEQAPGSRVRRSGYAVWLALVGTVCSGFAALAVVQGLRWAGMLTRGWDVVAGTLVHAAFVGAAMSALAGALLQRRQASWRLVPIGDEAAGRLRLWAWGAAGLTILGLLFIRLNDAIGVSGPASAAGEAVVALAFLLLISGILLTIGKLRAASIRASEGAEAPAQRTGVTVGLLVGWVAVVAGIAALLSGYLGLARWIALTTLWLTVVGSALFLLLKATDDVATTLFSRESRFGRSAHYGLGVRESAIDQFGVVTSALLRLTLVLGATGLVLMPFGTDVGSLFDTVWLAMQGITIGEVTISPGAVLRAVAVLGLGLFLVRLAQGWLTGQYLPTTELDASARNSITMVARYTGFVLVVLWAIAALGIGLERLAILLSALSVGIGFGLQAITQNFVSGLILLAERPVKIGDWVKISNQEGDIKRISVRATEIQVADGSTLIVPNSELITKTIQNMTLADPTGRIQVQFSVPLGTDAGQVRDTLQQIFQELPGVLDTPAPSVFIDHISDGRICFNCFAYASSPRAAYGVRSAVLFDLLDRFGKAGVDIGTRQRVEIVRDGEGQ